MSIKPSKNQFELTLENHDDYMPSTLKSFYLRLSNSPSIPIMQQRMEDNNNESSNNVANNPQRFHGQQN